MFKIVSLKLQNNGVYKNNNISDRFFSYDDIYCARRIFILDPSLKYSKIESSVKHPLFVFSANYASIFENKIYSELDFEKHYNNIINVQILLSVLSIIFIFLILFEIFEIKALYSFWLSIVFLLANCTIISTILIERIRIFNLS